jgi:hypothetical protein
MTQHESIHASAQGIANKTGRTSPACGVCGATFEPLRPIAIRLNAGNDANGNPRRVYVLIDGDTGAIIDTQDEGYAGPDAYRDKHPGAVESVTFMTTPGEYRAMVRFAHDHYFARPATPGARTEPERHAHNNDRKHRHPENGLGVSR